MKKFDKVTAKPGRETTGKISNEELASAWMDPEREQERRPEP